MKRVICIGGTSHSGSTLLDNILANDPRAMSLGEIVALFHPTRKHHFEELDILKKHEIWNIIINSGKRNLYPNLFKFFPNKDIFVDSSKDPFWFKYHEKEKKENYLIEHVLIYKKPIELAQSFLKRGKKDDWIRTYISYHKKYFALIRDFNSISYKSLVQDDKALKRLCVKLSLDYSESKKDYWEAEPTTFFGSNTIRSSNGITAKRQLKEIQRIDINYDLIPDDNIGKYVEKAKLSHPQLSLIENFLDKKSQLDNMKGYLRPPIKYYKQMLFLFSLKRAINHFYYKIYPIDFFNEKNG